MSSLCQSFIQISHNTSCDLRHAWASNLSFGEETITETNLLALKRRHPKNIVVYSFTKKIEATNGADWEWWFVDGAKQMGLPMRVQAKRLPKNSELFKGLLTYRTAGASRSQIENLIISAEANAMVPIHCLYLDESIMTRSGYKHRKRLGLGGFEAELGCWVGLSTRIKRNRQRSLYGLQHLIFPWHYLVCPNTSAEGQSPSLPERVYETLRRPPGRALDNQLTDDEIPRVRELPGYVLELLDLGLSARSLSSLLEQNLRGVAIFSEPRETTT